MPDVKGPRVQGAKGAKVQRSKGPRVQRSKGPRVPREAQPARHWWPLVVIVLAAVAVYWNSLGNPFVFDDHVTIIDNTNIRSLSTAFHASTGSALTGRPLVGLSFALNYAVGGLNILGYRLVNIALHAACGLLLFGAARRTMALPSLRDQLAPSGEGLAFAIALLWTVHPLNTEVVDYLTQRTESLMALCLMVVMYANARAVGQPRSAVWQLPAIAAAALGMLCKETMVVVPLLVVVYDRVFVFESIAAAWRSRWRFYLALAATWLVVAIGVATATRELAGGYASTHVSAWSYFWNQMPIITHYLWLVVWPRDLVAYYGWSLPATLSGVWPYALFIAVAFGCAAWVFARAPRLGFLPLWFFLTLGPTSSILPIAAEVGADRRMYVPVMGILALTVVLGWRLLRDRSRAGVVVLAVVVVALSARTIARNRDYASELALSQSTLRAWPSGVAHDMVGLSLVAAGRMPEATDELRQAAVDYPPAHYDLGAALFVTGHLDDALTELRRFVQLEPNLFTTSQARTLIGRALLAQHHVAEAAQELALAASGPQANPQAHVVLAELLLDTQQFAGAVDHYRAYLAAFPSDARAMDSLGIALASANRGAEAIAVLRQAVQLMPNRAGTRENLARVLIDAGQIDAGAAEVRQALVLSPASPGAHDLMGLIFLAQKKIDDARREFLEALRFDPNFADAREHLRRIGG